MAWCAATSIMPRSAPSTAFCIATTGTGSRAAPPWSKTSKAACASCAGPRNWRESNRCCALMCRRGWPRSRTELRIAIVSDAWRPQINGVVRTIETIVRLLQAEGHEVEVFGPDRFRTLPCPTYPEIRLSLFPSARLNHMLKLFAPDAIHLVTEGPLGWAARRFCLTREIPFTTAYHTRFPEYVRARIRVPLAWSYAFVRRFHAPSSAVLVVAQSIRDELAAHGF